MIAIVGVIIGLALRVALLLLPTGAPDADEAVVGLMAVHALEDGEFTTFFWGQFYGGSIEAMLAVPLFAVLGATPLVLRLVPMALSAVAALLVWRLGRRTVGARAGAVAGLAVWIWPLQMVWFSTRPRGFYMACLVLGLALLLVATHLAEEPRRARGWLLLGLLTGLGWWTSPQILYFAVPAGIWLVARLRAAVWPHALLALPAAAVGALPWLTFNLRHGWLSLEVTNRGQDAGWAGNAWVLLREGVPVILGLRSADGWIVPILFPVLYVALAVFVVVGVARRARGTSLLALGVVTYLPIYALLPVSGVVGEGRYVLFLLPFLALLIAHVAGSRRLQLLFLGGALALSLATVPILDGHTSPFVYDRRVPEDLDPLIAALTERGIEHVATDYWIAYRLIFESDRRIIAASAIDRHPPYDAAVGDDPDTVWVFIEGSELVDGFEWELAQRGIAAERWEVAGFVVIEPASPVYCWPVPPILDHGCTR